VSSKTPAKSAIAEKESASKPAAAPKPAAKAPSTKADSVKSAAEATPKTTPAKAATAKLPSDAPAATRAHAPTPSTASFTDRFAPAKPTTKTYPEPMNAVKTAAKADPKLANAWKTKSGRDLTEAELLAMPESEYMNEKQLEFFRNRLQEQKDALLSNAGETTEHLREDTSIVPDPADRATIEEEHALELRTRDRERKLLKKISQSLGRIEAGDYGYCDETGEPIGLGRLLARPTATLSLEAQQRREMKQKMFGD
jgi:DnaK suppressor protein